MNRKECLEVAAILNRLADEIEKRVRLQIEAGQLKKEIMDLTLENKRLKVINYGR